MSGSTNTLQEIRQYKFLKTEYSHLRALENKNTTKAVMECRFLGEKNGKRQYYIKTTNYRQTNTQGMFGWVNDLQVLKENLHISITEDGLLDKTLNMEQIRSKWASIKNKTIKKHSSEKRSADFAKLITKLLEDEEKFTASLRYVTPYISLFSGFSKNTQKEECYREIPNFMGAKIIPIKAEAAPLATENSSALTEIIANGKIDKDNFNQAQVTDFVRTMRENLRARAEVQLRYTERYAFNGHALPTQAMCMSMVVIPGFLYRNEKSFLKAIL